MRPELVLMPAALAVIFPLQGWIDGPAEARRRGERGQPPSIFETVPSPRIAPILALGHRETMADLLEIRAATFFSRTLEQQSILEREQLNRLYETITALDPADPGPWLRWSQLMFALIYDVDFSYTICARGLSAVPAAHPQRWRLSYEEGSIRLMQSVTAQDDATRTRALADAGHRFLETADLPGLPDQDRSDLRDIALRLIARGLPRAAVLQQEAALWEQKAREAKEGAVRESYRHRSLESRAALRCVELEDELARRAKAGHPARSLAELGPIDDPLGTGFVLLPDGHVTSPGVEAGRLERLLEPRLARWRAEHPGRTPTLADLDPPPAPSYLSVAIDGDHVRVQVRR